MTMNRFEQFLDLVSINKQLRLYNEGFDNIIPSSGRVLVKKGTKYYVIVVDNTITYRVDKNNFKVYDFSKRFLGTIEEMVRQLQETIASYPKRPGFSPKVSYQSRSVNPSKGFVGKIFMMSWGYDQTNNEFVEVVRETDKQVVVRKLMTSQDYSSMSMTGSEAPLPGNYSSNPFRLMKTFYNGKPALRGVDKSGSGSSQSALWTEWNGERVAFSSYA